MSRDEHGDADLTATTINGGTLVDNGTVVANGSVNVGSAVTTISTGAFTIDNGATLEFSSSVAAGITVSFAGATGTLQFDDPAGFAGTVSNFGGSSVIDLTDIAYSSSEHTVWTQSTGTLAIYLGATLEDTIKLSGTYNQDNFSLAPDSIPGTPGTDVLWWGGGRLCLGNGSGEWDAAGNGRHDGGAVTGERCARQPRQRDVRCGWRRRLQCGHGVGDSASLTIAGSTSLDGQFTTGTLTVNNNETLALSSGATLTATSLTASYNDTFDLTGATLTATSLTMTSYDDTFDLTGGTLTLGSVSMYEDETFSLSSGATLSITGNVTDTYGNSYYSINDSKFTVGGLFTSTNDYIYADGGGIVQLAGLAVATSSTIVLEVEDATSSIEIGTAGGVAAGSLTIDSGVTVTASGFFYAPTIVDDGTLAVAAGGSLTLDGSSAAAARSRSAAAALWLSRTTWVSRRLRAHRRSRLRAATTR